MDPLSITVACVGLLTTVTKVSIQINGFIREVRDARGDLDYVSRELLSLKTVLEILSEDASSSNGGFPPSLVRQISGILTNCGGVLEHIEASLQKHSGGGIRRGMKWSFEGRDDMNKLRSSLEAHKSALDIALDMVALSMAREIKADTQEIRTDTAAIKDDTTQILAEIARLQARLPQDDRTLGGNGFTLQRYLDNLSSYAETSGELSDNGSDKGADMERAVIQLPRLNDLTEAQDAPMLSRSPSPVREGGYGDPRYVESSGVVIASSGHQLSPSVRMTAEEQTSTIRSITAPLLEFPVKAAGAPKMVEIEEPSRIPRSDHSGQRLCLPLEETVEDQANPIPPANTPLPDFPVMVTGTAKLTSKLGDIKYPKSSSGFQTLSEAERGRRQGRAQPAPRTSGSLDMKRLIGRAASVARQIAEQEEALERARLLGQVTRRSPEGRAASRAAKREGWAATAARAAAQQKGSGEADQRISDNSQRSDHQIERESLPKESLASVGTRSQLHTVEPSRKREIKRVRSDVPSILSASGGEPEPIRRIITAEYSAEQLEPARQLKEEFRSSSENLKTVEYDDDHLELARKLNGKLGSASHFRRVTNEQQRPDEEGPWRVEYKGVSGKLFQAKDWVMLKGKYAKPTVGKEKKIKTPKPAPVPTLPKETRTKKSKPTPPLDMEEIRRRMFPEESRIREPVPPPPNIFNVR